MSTRDDILAIRRDDLEKILWKASNAGWELARGFITEGRAEQYRLALIAEWTWRAPQS